jgi:RNA polymerase primary sigma factor/RNA polymerase nonessential primary-like sigma factor
MFDERNEALNAVEVEESKDTPDLRRLTRLRRDLDTITASIVEANLGLVHSYVSKFTSHTSPEDSADFLAAGVAGLMVAIDRYDPAKGSFGPWAYRPIKRQVLRALRDADFANLNRGDFDRRPDILRAQARLTGEDMPAPSIEEVAAEGGFSTEVVRRVLTAPQLQSLSTRVGDGDGDLSELLSDDVDIADEVIRDLSVSALEIYGLTKLDPRELFVVVRRFGLDGEAPSHLSTIGRQLNLSREAARQILCKALAKMAHPVTLRGLVRFNDPQSSKAPA